MVIGPTPPGTGVIYDAVSMASAKQTSPFRPSGVRLMPTSMIMAPGLMKSPGYKFRFSDCGDQNIRRAAKRCKPPGTRMGYGYRAVFVEEQMRRRQTDDLRTSDNYGV